MTDAARAARIGILGGSGLYGISHLENAREITLDTPFGAPSDAYMLGTLAGQPVAFLARHGVGHRILPTELNNRANVHGFKQLGVRWLISVSAVGSMHEDYAPTHVVVPDQFFDRTRHRPDTFFGGGVVAHVSMADPISQVLAEVLSASAEAVGVTTHRGGTYLCMEGPQFSTRAESRIYRQWGVDVIGMTNLQEARLAREAEISFATLAMITDYDCWHETEEDVSVEAVIGVLRQNAEAGQRIVADAVERLASIADDACPHRDALKYALITDPTRITPDARQRLALLLDRYLDAPAAG
ncbi:MAG: S-methyl-5'-thioadenosine phosphorylase [Acidobacteriota bacterium]